MRFERLSLLVAVALTFTLAPTGADAQVGRDREQRIRADDVPGMRSRAPRELPSGERERQDRLLEQQMERVWDQERRVHDQQRRVRHQQERHRERSRALQERAVARAIERAMEQQEAAERRREEARIRASRIRWS